MPGPNKQPLFAGTLKLVTTTFDPPVITDNYNTQNGAWSTPPQFVYTASATNGDIVDRITISATADLSNPNVTDKLIYIYLYDGVNYSLYKTLVMPAAILSTTVANPELELVFQGGLMLPPSNAIYMGASTNYTTTSYSGDKLSITIEAGTYDS